MAFGDGIPGGMGSRNLPPAAIEAGRALGSRGRQRAQWRLLVGRPGWDQPSAVFQTAIIESVAARSGWLGRWGTLLASAVLFVGAIFGLAGSLGADGSTARLVIFVLATLLFGWIFLSYAGLAYGGPRVAAANAVLIGAVTIEGAWQRPAPSAGSRARSTLVIGLVMIPIWILMYRVVSPESSWGETLISGALFGAFFTFFYTRNLRRTDRSRA